MPTTYRAMMITRPGGPEVLQTVELPVVDPGPGELRVAVRASGVGATDLTMLAGDYMFAPKIPFIGGYEIAGVVEAIGAGVTGFRVGQRVAALTVYGGFAERLVRGAEHFVPIPDEVSDVEAVAVILNYVTAWQMIHRVAHVRAGQTALVTGAGGGVGTALLQLLGLAGVKTYGAASAKKHGLVTSLGPRRSITGSGRLIVSSMPTSRRVSISSSMPLEARTLVRAYARHGAAEWSSAMALWRSMARWQKRECSGICLSVPASADATEHSTASRYSIERTQSPFTRTYRKSWRWWRKSRSVPSSQPHFRYGKQSAPSSCWPPALWKARSF
jgi:D-arabinose 1-dehydrogenase-like Zn-dependent alcohol dehydrogenase